MTGHTKLCNDIMDYLKTLKPACRFFKAIPSKYSEAGISDLIGSYKGCFCAIEVKTPKDDASRKQALFQKQIRATAGYAIIARSVNEVKNLILEIDHAEKCTSLSKAKLVGSPTSTR